MAPTRGVQHEFQKLFRARFSRKREAQVREGEKAGRQASLERSPADRHDKVGFAPNREQRQYAPRGDDVYKLFSRASFVTTIERIARLNPIKFEFAFGIHLTEKNYLESSYPPSSVYVILSILGGQN